MKSKRPVNSKKTIIKPVISPIKAAILTVLTIILITLVFYFITSIITKTTGHVISHENSDILLNNCLKQKEIALYLNSNDIQMTLAEMQLNNPELHKPMSDHLQSIKIFNCMENNELCKKININSFPTWIINSNKIQRDISEKELIQYSGC